MSRIVKYLVFDFFKNFVFYLILFVFLIYLLEFTIFPNGLNLENKPLFDVILLFMNIPFGVSLLILIAKILHFRKKDNDNVIYITTKDIVVKGDLDSVYQKIKDYIHEKKYFIFKEDDNSFTLKYFTKLSFLSNGELVKVEIIKGDNGFVVINVSSKLIGLLQLIDWGKNKRNINKLEAYLSEIKQV